MRVWITKYALTQGILEDDARVCGEVSPDMIEIAGKPHSYFHGLGRDWHLSKEDAVRRAEKMRTEKISSLKKSLAKFEALRFE